MYCRIRKLCLWIGIWMVVYLILPAYVWSEAGTSLIKWSIGGNVNYYFSPFHSVNRELKNSNYPEITSNTPPLGLELTRFKYDSAWNAKRSLSFLYIYWQGKGKSGNSKIKVIFHEFAAKVRVYVFRHLDVSPFWGCGLGFQQSLTKFGDEYRNHGGVITPLTGIEWQSKSRRMIIRLEGGYRHIPSNSEWPRGVKANTSCWLVGATVGINMGRPG